MIKFNANMRDMLLAGGDYGDHKRVILRKLAEYYVDSPMTDRSDERKQRATKNHSIAQEIRENDMVDAQRKAVTHLQTDLLGPAQTPVEYKRGSVMHRRLKRNLQDCLAHRPSYFI